MGSRLFLQDFPRRLQARPFAPPSLPPPKARMGAHTQALRMAASTRLSRKITRLRAVTGRSPFMRRTVLPSMARIGRPQVRGKVRHTPSAVHAARGRGQVRRFCQQIGIFGSRRAWAGTSVFALPPAGTWACASAAAVRPACRSRRDGLQEEESARRGGAEGFAVLRENCFQNWCIAREIRQRTVFCKAVRFCR